MRQTEAKTPEEKFFYKYSTLINQHLNVLEVCKTKDRTIYEQETPYTLAIKNNGKKLCLTDGEIKSISLSIDDLAMMISGAMIEVAYQLGKGKRKARTYQLGFTAKQTASKATCKPYKARIR